MWAAFAMLARAAYAADGFILTEPVQIALIASATTTFTSLVTMIVTIINNRKLEGVRKATDGMSSALVKADFKEGHVAGGADKVVQLDAKDALHTAAVQEGRDEVKAEAAVISKAIIDASSPTKRNAD